jgi:hypothetical protein
VVQQLRNGSITTEQALLMMQQMARESGKQFQGVTQTGRVAFLGLQGPIQKLATANINVNAALAEQAKNQNNLSDGLLKMQNASKTLTAGFESLQTGMMSFLGNLPLGFIPGLMKVIGSTLQKLPTVIQALLYLGTTIGGWLANKAAQVAVVAEGTYLGFTAAQRGGFTNAAFRQLGIANPGRKKTSFAQAGSNLSKNISNRIPGFQVPGLSTSLKGLGGGLALEGLAFGTDALADSARKRGSESEEKGYGILSSMLRGAGFGSSVGTFFGPEGILLGALIGGTVGLGSGIYNAIVPGKAVGGAVSAGQPYMVGERGPELFTPNTAGSITSNSQLSASMSQNGAIEQQLLTNNQYLAELVKYNKQLVAHNEETAKYTKKISRKSGNDANS